MVVDTLVLEGKHNLVAPELVRRLVVDTLALEGKKQHDVMGRILWGEKKKRIVTECNTQRHYPLCLE